MRKTLTILALGCLLFLTGGYHLLYQLRLAEVKSAVKKDLSRLQKNDLTPLSLSPAEVAKLDWEDATEFRYQDKMYDVVKMETEGAQTIYWCLADEKETALVEAYLKTQNGSSDKDTSHSLFKLLKVPFLPAAFQWNKGFAVRQCEPFSFYCVRLFMFETSVLTPPPKFC